MPQIISPETGQARVVSDAEFTRQRQLIASERQESMYHDASELRDTMRVWDAVDGMWTGFVPRNTGEMLLREVVLKCSACAFTSSYDGAVAKHVAQVREQAEQHKKARVVGQTNAAGEYGEICKGCGQRFQTRKRMAHQHLARAKEMGLSHKVELTEVVMRRFSRFENEKTVLGERRIG